jgi:methionine-rich copper-binding protein CopC
MPTHHPTSHRAHSAHRARRRLALAATTLAALAGTLLATAAPAAAHDVLVSTSPKDGASVATTPSTVVLTFEEPALAVGTKVVVTGPDGPVQDGDARLVGSTVRQDLVPGSPAGAYRVQWRVTSDDGHAVSGTFSFTSKAASTPTATPLANPSTSAASQPSATSTGGPSTSAADPTSDHGGTSDRGVPWWLIIVVVLIGGFALVRTQAGRQGRRRGPS